MLWERVYCWDTMTVPFFGLVSPLQQGQGVAALPGTCGEPKAVGHPQLSLFSSSNALTGSTISTILLLCRALSWLTRTQLSFGLEGVEPQLILKGWDVIPKYFYYQLSSRQPNRILWLCRTSSTWDQCRVWGFLQSWMGRCCLPKESSCVFCKHLHRVLPLSMVMDLQTPASDNHVGMSELFVSASL